MFNISGEPFEGFDIIEVVSANTYFKFLSAVAKNWLWLLYVILQSIFSCFSLSLGMWIFPFKREQHRCKLIYVFISKIYRCKIQQILLNSVWFWRKKKPEPEDCREHVVSKQYGFNVSTFQQTDTSKLTALMVEKSFNRPISVTWVPQKPHLVQGYVMNGSDFRFVQHRGLTWVYLVIFPSLDFCLLQQQEPPGKWCIQILTNIPSVVLLKMHSFVLIHAV